MKRAMLGAFLCCIVAQGWAAGPFRENSPQSYTVVKGDALWDIAERFLDNPWDWAQVWQKNPNIPNPDKIYPGDVVEMIYVNDQPKLTISRGKWGRRVETHINSNGISERTIKLSPKIRATPIEDAIPTIPLTAIDAFLTDSRILESEGVLESAPYIVSMEKKGGLIGSAGDTLYARGGILADAQTDYDVYRLGRSFKDPGTGEHLGVLASSVGTLNKRGFSDEKQIATMLVTSTNQELRLGDRILPAEGRIVPSSYFPTAPENKSISGSIIDVVGGVKSTGLYGNILVNIGTDSGLENGDILAVYRTKTIRDKVTGDTITLPPKRIGILMAYRTYQKISFAIVMQAGELIEVGDELRAP